ncbi:DUF2798 domain-containing protein [Acaricomes phytoseiuli]|uniref:DUF2798 domain-containing protein n=1 Tax=Acaricomes phytoseiuli TaxID=291968 RepID=UPI00035E784D|nr:DUF2798 domain-containing protein [Acaricomes phytoseiuli]
MKNLVEYTLIAFLVSIFLSFVLTAVNVGFTDDFVQVYWKSVLIAFGASLLFTVLSQWIAKGLMRLFAPEGRS